MEHQTKKDEESTRRRLTAAAESSVFFVAFIGQALGMYILYFYLSGGRDMGIVEGVIASLLAAGLVGLGGFFLGRRTYEQRAVAAARIYADHLDRLIRDANLQEGRQVRISAQAIVSTRNDLRSSLVALNSLLNSDIDVLAELIESDASVGQLADRLKVLEKKWPAKKDQVAVELRKLLSELGLIPKR